MGREKYSRRREISKGRKQGETSMFQDPKVGGHGWNTIAGSHKTRSGCISQIPQLWEAIVRCLNFTLLAPGTHQSFKQRSRMVYTVLVSS
jgi:hypothetical protein